MQFLIEYSALITKYIHHNYENIKNSILYFCQKKNKNINPNIILNKLITHLQIKKYSNKLNITYESLKTYKIFFSKIYKLNISRNDKIIIKNLFHYLTTARFKIYNIILLMTNKNEKINYFSSSEEISKNGVDRQLTFDDLKKTLKKTNDNKNNSHYDKTRAAREKLQNITKKIKKMEESDMSTTSEQEPRAIIRSKQRKCYDSDLNIEKIEKPRKAKCDTFPPSQSCCPVIPPGPPECDFNLDCQNFNILKNNLQKVFKILNIMRYTAYSLSSSFTEIINKFNYISMAQIATPSDIDYANKLIDLFASQFTTFADKISMNPNCINFGCHIPSTPPVAKIREFSLMLCGRLIIVCVVDCFGVSKTTTDPPTLIISTKNTTITINYIKFGVTYGEFSASLLSNIDSVNSLISLINSNQTLIQSGIEHVDQLICLEKN